jgi:hypothetical protein
MIPSFDKGDILRIKGTFLDIATNTPIDPSQTMFSYRKPSGVSQSFSYPTNPEVVRLEAGIYYCDVTFDESGLWAVRYHSTGTGQAAKEKNYFVRTSAF